VRFAERQVRGQGDRRLLLAFGQDLEEQLGPSGIELDVAELVQAEQVEASVAGDDAAEPALVGRLGQLVDQLGAGGVADPVALLAGGQAEADQQVRLARPAVA
jgi:hypothetical protein